MHTSNKHSHVTSLLLGIALALAMTTGAYAASGASTGAAFDGLAGVGSGVGALTVAFPGPLAGPGGLPVTRVYQSSFGSFSSSGDPQALTVDQSTGAVYVVSPAAGTVSRFTSGGAPDVFTAGADSGTNVLTGFSFDGPSAAQVAIAPAGAAEGTAGDIYVVSFAGVDVYANDGAHLGLIKEAAGSGFSEACGVAVDDAGRVYVGDFGGKIDRYVPSADPVTSTDYDAQITGASSPCNVAADSTGAVYASKWSEGPLTKYTAADFGSSGAGTVLDTPSRAVSIDPSTDDVYVDEGEGVSVFDSGGEPLYSFGSSGFGPSSAGVAVEGSGGNAYVANPNTHEVDVYGPVVVVPPTAITGEASAVHHANATLNGHLEINGGNPVTDCHFDWGNTSTYGNTTACAQGNDYAADADVSATITGLEPGKTYHYRLDISTGASTVTGADETFETVPVPIVHEYTATFGASGSGDGQLSGNTGLAVNQTTGDVYVADTSNHRVEEFDTSGAFISMFGWGVRDGSAEAQTCTSTCQTGIPGSGAGQLATPTFIAVDNSSGPSSGDVYVGDTTSNTVTKYDSDGNYISTNDGTASGTPFAALAGIAISTKGDLWVYDTNADMREFTQNSTFTTQWNSNIGVTPAGIAIDATETLYVVRGNPFVDRFSSSGVHLSHVSGAPGEPTFNGPTTGLAIDPTSGDLYVDDGGTLIRQYTNPSTCLAHGNEGNEGCTLRGTFGSGSLDAGSGVGVKGSNGRVYASDPDSVKIFDPAIPPDVTTGAATAPSATSATLTGTVEPNGVALTDCHFEYVSDAAFLTTGFSNLSSGGSASCSPSTGSVPADLEDHAVTATVTGLDPATIYHFRLIAANAQTGLDGQAAIVPGPPLVETTGSPTRTATTARLDSRLDPRGTTTTYHFEYGDQGPWDSNPCTTTQDQPAGSSETYELVSQQLTGLKANTTYHYRLVGNNETPNATINGKDATITTRSSDAPLTHGHHPGPPGSDRDWEQVNTPDTGGNPVLGQGISENGERALYAIDGGSPGSQNGGGLFVYSNLHFAERTPTGWQGKDLFPTRSQAPGNEWHNVLATSDFSRFYASNLDVTKAGPFQTWSLVPGAPAQRLLEVPFASGEPFAAVADQANRVLSVIIGSLDPAHPVGVEDQELYDLTTGTPRMVGLLPDGSVPPCGVHSLYMAVTTPLTAQQWISPDGSDAVFATYPTANTTCSGQPGLFVRDLVNSTTTQIATHGAFDRIAGENAFFTTPDSISPEDHGGTDLYRYNLTDRSTVCVTCSTPIAGSVISRASEQAPGSGNVAVSDDGSHAYLQSVHRLLQGAAEEGIYRLTVSTGDLAYVAPGGFGASIGNDPEPSAVSPDGSVLVFTSSNPSLDAHGGAKNAGTRQVYRYNDRDRSLVCASCPGNGSAPVAGVNGLGGNQGTGSTATSVTASGDLIFLTDTPLSSYDENTAHPGQAPDVGADVYEWLDGQLLLVTGGEQASSKLNVEGHSADGRNIFFTQAAQLTPDAPDAQVRLYDARIGGGFDFPQPPPPCSLDACQGNPAAPPVDSTPASAIFNGPGNQSHDGTTTKTVRTKTVKKARCKKSKKKAGKCGAPVRCKKGKKGSRCRKARHANTTRRTGR
jgi:hypothetical protein